MGLPATHLNHGQRIWWVALTSSWTRWRSACFKALEPRSLNALEPISPAIIQREPQKQVKLPDIQLYVTTAWLVSCWCLARNKTASPTLCLRIASACRTLHGGHWCTLAMLRAVAVIRLSSAFARCSRNRGRERTMNLESCGFSCRMRHQRPTPGAYPAQRVCAGGQWRPQVGF